MSSVKTTEKPARPAVKPGKVFDIAPPGKATPSSTARPVIITNRPMMQDPMMATDQPDDGDEKFKTKPLDKITIKPLGTSPAGEKNDVAAEETTEKSPAQDTPADRTPAEDTKAAEAEEPGEVAAVETPADASATTEPAEPTESAKTAEPDQKKDKPEPEAAAEAVPASSESKNDPEPEGTPAEDGVNTEDSKNEKEIAALEAKAKQEEAINQLVESRKYFLPINAVERHRSKVMSLLGLVLIVVLALVLVDMMLDAGALSIPGVHPVTHFFSS